MGAGRNSMGGATAGRGWGGPGWLLVLHVARMMAPTASLPLPRPHYRLLPPHSNETFFIHFNPPAINSLRVHTRQSVYFNCTKIQRYYVAQPQARTSTSITPATAGDIFPNTTNTIDNTTASAWGQRAPSYWAMIFSSDEKIALPVLASEDHVLGEGGVGDGWWGVSDNGATVGGGGGGAGDSQTRARPLVMEVRMDQLHNFSIQALHVGRVTMNVAVVEKQAASLMANNGHLRDNNLIQTVAASEYQVATVRGQRTADIVFDSSAAAISILITFGIGCCTDTESVKKQLKYPVSLIIGFCCQFILMPVLAFGLAMILPLDKDIRFGLLCTACVPGGGLGHIAVVIGDADIPLSLTMNLISSVAMLGTAPLWIFVLGQYFQTDPNAILSPRIIPIYNFEIWLASVFLAYATGLVVNRFRPVVAEILLMWVIKPLMLLATILYITVGVYINMYVFELINNYAVLGAILLPLVGCVLGCTLAAICRQRASFIKTIMLETSSLNCLIVLAALRFSLQQPDADLASMIPIWVMFTIPGLYVALAIMQKAKRTVMSYWNNRKTAIKEDKEYEVASAIVNRPGLAALSAPLVVADGCTDDEAGTNEKVTVL